MQIGIILSAIFVPACVTLALFLLQKSGTKKSKTMSDNNFTVMIPNFVIAVGAMGALTSTAILLSFSFLSDERPHFIFYVTFGLFFWLGMYLIIKTITFKVVVKGKTITVFSAFKKPYTFTFSEIASVVRQVKKNQIKSERLVIKTFSGRKIIVESAEISYGRFMNKIRAEVRSEYLVGFEQQNAVKPR